MAALCPGVQYGLSSQESFGENKDLIFVKLTDSALRAIEEYLRNQNKLSQNPTIKFLGNEGQLSFPSLQNGCTSFNFSMSSTADMEGPGGSFECIKQSAAPRGSLEALGAIPNKIRIHANEDVYEATRHRMTVAEENHKNKCTREIKPNQNDIGRKVKVKQIPGRTATVPPPSRRDTPPLMRESLIKPSSQPNLNSRTPPLYSNSNGLSNGLGSNYINNSRPLQNKPSNPEIMRRPIKERLIHILALRPHKKPELVERLNKEGLRERNSITSILKQIAYMKDNAYHLNRAMWNDVREDWPFYTEVEQQTLKRRKPQNLTPPGSSDGGSSGSGHSPTSTHPGSPPPPISTPKRPGYYDGVDGLPTKRQRISHFRKPSEQVCRSPIDNNNSQRRPTTDSRDASNMNPRSREPSLTNGYYNGYLGNGFGNDKHSLSEEDEDEGCVSSTTDRKRFCDSHSLSFGVNREKTFSASLLKQQESPSKNGVVVTDKAKAVVPISEVLTNGSSKHIDHERGGGGGGGGGGRSGGSSSRSVDTTNGFLEKHDEQISATDSGPPSKRTVTEVEVNPEFPDYLTEYTTIKDPEQRRRYKADFNADYNEYKQLHAVVEKVSRRFAELEERLKQEDESSPKYKDIKKLIVKEYRQNKQDLNHQRDKRRFQYLHEKLSHIKRLVLEYDQSSADHQY